jgi:hypothetical protein
VPDVVDVGGHAHRPGHIGQFLTGFPAAHLVGGGANGLDDQGKPAGGFVAVADGQGDAFAALAHADDDELPRFGVLDDARGIDDQPTNVGRERLRLKYPISHIPAPQSPPIVNNTN